ncbi:MAG: hypothetical protein FWE14_09305 [Lachnospiraceae bacterium]|nr:hypothetical protein [Lachnospiraceae bacterium]
MSIEWKTPVTDREPADIVNKSAKAYLNAEDLSRIESNAGYISVLLNLYLYPILIQSKKWDKVKIPTTADIKRICDNVDSFADVFYRPNEFADVKYLAEKSLGYQDVNDLETNLLLIKTLLDYMIAGFHKSNQTGFKAGKNSYLPRRRV